MTETWTRRQLLMAGMTVRAIAGAMHTGALIRVRRGIYANPDADPAMIRAVRVGGCLACVSELRARGVWVLDDVRVHVHLAPNASRQRDPDDRTLPLTERSGCRLHWRPLVQPERATPEHVGTVDALLQSAECLATIEVAASVDSALRLGIVSRSELARAARELPQPRRWPFERPDPSAESGIETIARELLRALGFAVHTQAPFPGVGRVDLVVEGWIVVETDGTAFHDAVVTARDRRRDAVLVARGFTVLRFRYSQVVFARSELIAAVISAVESHRRVPNAGSKARRARRRAEKLELT